MSHGIVDVFAFQEALLIEAVFGIALLAMIWVGFRRWLQHKERMGRLMAEQTADSTAQDRAQMERVEARLQAVEQIVSDGAVQTLVQMDPLSASPLQSIDVGLTRGDLPSEGTQNAASASRPSTGA